MFRSLSINQSNVVFSTKEFKYEDSEDEHYEEIDDDNSSYLDDGIFLDQTIVDEYDDFEDEMESDIPEPIDSDIVHHNSFIDEEEAEHYDSFEEDE